MVRSRRVATPTQRPVLVCTQRCNDPSARPVIERLTHLGWLSSTTYNPAPTAAVSSSPPERLQGSVTATSRQAAHLSVLEQKAGDQIPVLTLHGMPIDHSSSSCSSDSILPVAIASMFIAAAISAIIDFTVDREDHPVRDQARPDGQTSHLTTSTERVGSGHSAGPLANLPHRRVDRPGMCGPPAWTACEPEGPASTCLVC